MPLMREWTEIAVDEDLLVPVVRELLDMAVNPNQVEIVHGVNGRTILAEVHLAEHWYQERLKRDNDVEVHVDKDFEVLTDSEVVAPVEAVVAPVEVAAQSNIPTETAAQSSMTEGTAHLVSLPVKRGPGRPRKELPPSASPDGEEP